MLVLAYTGFAGFKVDLIVFLIGLLFCVIFFAVACVCCWFHSLWSIVAIRGRRLQCSSADEATLLKCAQDREVVRFGRWTSHIGEWVLLSAIFGVILGGAWCFFRYA